MTELARACSKTYFARFKMHLNEALTDADIDEDFNCKWKDIESALDKAIGREKNIARLFNFSNKSSSEFHSQPLELIIDQVDNHVNMVLRRSTTIHTDTKGRVLSDFTYTIKTKYLSVRLKFS